MNLRSRTTTDLQSVPFGHSGTPPHYNAKAGADSPRGRPLFGSGAGDGTRTRNLLITNQLLCQLSYAGGKKNAYPVSCILASGWRSHKEQPCHDAEQRHKKSA